MTRIGLISVHTCPLAALGGKETGGMNVYVREVARHLGRLGLEVDVFTRSQTPGIPPVVPLGPGARVVHIEAGPQRPVLKLSSARSEKSICGKVALKAIAPGLLHKTEAGAVRLGLGGASVVQQAAVEMAARLAAEGSPPTGYLVQRMVPPGAETGFPRPRPLSLKASRKPPTTGMRQAS